jgi:hypothetical protein
MVSTSQDPGPSVPPGPDEPEATGRGVRPASVRGPALVVLGIAVFIVVAGVAASALASGNAPTTSLRSVTLPAGTVVPLTPALVAMKRIVNASEPPADIIGNLAVPSGSQVTHVVNTDQGQAQFDRTVAFTTQLSSGQVVELYRTLLPRLRWRVVYAGPGTGHFGSQGTEVLAKLGSGDGFYWEVGVVVSDTTSAGITPFSVELFELPDDS